MELQRLEFYVSRMLNLVIKNYVISFLRTKATIVAFVAKGLRPDKNRFVVSQHCPKVMKPHVTASTFIIVLTMCHT